MLFTVLNVVLIALVAVLVVAVELSPLVTPTLLLHRNTSC